MKYMRFGVVIPSLDGDWSGRNAQKQGYSRVSVELRSDRVKLWSD